MLNTQTHYLATYAKADSDKERIRVARMAQADFHDQAMGDQSTGLRRDSEAIPYANYWADVLWGLKR